MRNKTLYEKLGVSKDASKEEIKRAFRLKAKESHPDTGGDEKEFVEVNKAYKILSNHTLRIIYDKTGEEEVVDTTMAQAVETLKSLFITMINTHKTAIINIDYLSLMKNEITNEMKAIKKSKDGAEVALKTLKELSEDLLFQKKEGSTPNILLITITEQIQMLEYEKIKSDRKKEILEASLKIISHYKKKKEVTKPSGFFPAFTFENDTYYNIGT